ncbi:putative short-chain dehydrogenase, partial [Acaromyces ingoldii]
LEFIRQLSQNQNNAVFAIVRDTTSSPKLTELAASKQNVHIIQGDLNSFFQLREAAKNISSVTGGSLDVLINNAAYLDDSVATVQPSQLSDPEHVEQLKDAIEKSVESNVLGTIHLTNTFLPLIEQGNEKKIIHTSTGLADTDVILGTEISGLVPYSASKAMMNAVVAKYGAELKPRGIHVVALSPGFVDTNPMPQEALDWMSAMFRKIDLKVNGRISVEESVRDQLDTISKLGWDVQGRMISQHGDRNWF